jgi:SH3 domain-containing YSC84-like protein 1
MAKAKGIYLVPDFGRGAFIIGGRGGAGLVLAHRNGKWTDPVFFDFGAISFGAQAGGSGGPVAFLLMSDQAIDKFKSSNKISLNAEAGLSIVNFSKDAQASWGKGDIIIWSNTKGAYAGATASVTDINYADGNNQAYYGKQVDPSQILNGTAAASAEPTSPATTQLKKALPG